MKASTESIGVIFDFNDIGNVSLAQQVAINTLGKDRIPSTLTDTELVLPIVYEGEEVLLNSEMTEKIISLAQLAVGATDLRSYNARNRYMNLKHNGADDDFLMAASLEDRLEEEYTQVFRGLSEQALTCITESADIVLDRGLNQLATSNDQI